MKVSAARKSQALECEEAHVPTQRKTRDGASVAFDISSRQLMQRERMNAVFGDIAQREVEEDEIIQGKFSPVQRVEDEDHEGPMQLKSLPVQRVEDEELEDEFPLQAKFAGSPESIQRETGESAAPRENRTGMPDQLKANLEAMSGFDLSDVRVHRNSDKPAQLSALAYAQGNEIHLGPGQEQHLPHEAWHVVQQRQGGVRATMQMHGVAVNDDAELEREADEMGDRVLRRSDNPLQAAVKKDRQEIVESHGHEDSITQCNGKALAELKEHLRKVPTYMHEAIYRWVALIGASAVLAYLTAGGSLMTQVVVFLLPTTGWLASGVLKLVYDRTPFSGGGLKIGTGPLIEDTFHLATYQFPWSAGTYKTISDATPVDDGQYIFILDVNNIFSYVTSQDRYVEGARLYIRHSQLAGGAKVKTAGRMLVSDGKRKCVLINESGHYWPPAQSLSSAENFLKRLKIFDSVLVESFDKNQ